MRRAPGNTRLVSDQNRFDRLTRRHRECLLGVRQLKGSKEIADDLGIEKSTVDSYLTEAVRVLGARNRRDAALQLDEHERGIALAVQPAPEQGPEIGLETTPDKIRGDSAGLFPTPPSLSSSSSPDELVVGQEGAWHERHHRFPGARLPFRRKGQTNNDLSVGDRLIWIQLIAVGAAVGFGMLATGLQVLTEVLESVTRHLS